MLRKIIIPALLVMAWLPSQAQARREVRFNIISTESFRVQPYHASIVLPTGWSYIGSGNVYDQHTFFFSERRLGADCLARASSSSFESGDYTSSSPQPINFVNTFLNMFVLNGFISGGTINLKNTRVGGVSWRRSGPWRISSANLGAYAGSAAYTSAKKIAGRYYAYPGAQISMVTFGCTASQVRAMVNNMRSMLASFQLVSNLSIPRTAKPHRPRPSTAPTFTG